MVQEKSIYNVKIFTPDGEEHNLLIGEDEYILDAALASGLEINYSCLQGWCLTCAVKIISGKINQSDSRRYYEKDRENGFGLICTGKPGSDIEIRLNATEEMKELRSKNNLPFPRGKWGKS